ncbi:MAG: hypothetical protein AAB388_03395 [Patescibacteria group bacterium]
MDDTLIQERLQGFSQKYRAFVESEFVNQASTDLAEEAELTEQQRVVLSNGFMLYLLYFFTRSDLETFLVENGIQSETSMAVVGAFMSILPTTVSDTHDTIVLGTVEDNVTTAKATPNLPIKPDEKTVSQVRTMAEDMNEARTQGEAVYSSTQAALLEESRKNVQRDEPQQGEIKK